MCGRYNISLEDAIGEDELREIFEELERKEKERQEQGLSDSSEHRKLSGEIFPSDIVPIVANNKSLAPTPFMMKWGFVAPWDNKKLVINARSETASDKPMFREGMLKRRCLIPATNYYEWQKTDAGKVKHAIWPKDHKFMYMAGIYQIRNNQPEFTILTRSPGKEIAFIHERMPVILPLEAKKYWLNINQDAEEVLKTAMLDMEYKTA